MRRAWKDGTGREPYCHEWRETTAGLTYRGGILRLSWRGNAPGLYSGLPHPSEISVEASTAGAPSRRPSVERRQNRLPQVRRDHAGVQRTIPGCASQRNFRHAACVDLRCAAVQAHSVRAQPGRSADRGARIQTCAPQAQRVIAGPRARSRGFRLFTVSWLPPSGGGSSHDQPRERLVPP